MPRIPIDDLDDPRIAIYRSLKATNLTRQWKQFVVEGERLVERLLSSRFPVVSLLVTDRHESKLGVSIADAIPTYVVPHAVVDAIVGFPFHRGVLACAERRPWPSLEAIATGPDPDRPLFLAICPKLSNPENLGALARIGDVFGIDAILVGPECPDPFSRRVLRVSMGAVLRLPVIVCAHLIDAADRLARTMGIALVRDRRPAATARAGPRRRARRHRCRVARSLPARRHDPHETRGQLAERRRGGRHSDPALDAPRRVSTHRATRTEMSIFWLVIRFN
jgi:tRNA G18 (ribose-2'-O)-methylase SpoU